MTNNTVFKYFDLAADAALSKNDERTFFLGAVSLRKDGATVKACNGPSKVPTKQAHAEYRVARKSTPESVVFVVRVRRDGNFAMAKPCGNCLRALKFKKVKSIYYSISNSEYGVIIL